MIYLDNASTTFPFDEVLETYIKYSKNNFFNPSTIYKAGKNNSVLEEKIKSKILEFLKIKNKKIIFTSSATEANNLAIFGYLLPKANKGYNIITTNIEHKSVFNAFKFLESNGFEVRYLHINNNHQISIEELNSLIDKNTIFCSVMAVNNETGNILNIDEAKKTLNGKRIIFHSDFAQTLFKTKLSLCSIPDMFTISSHKIHGLKSIAALIYDEKIQLQPQILGGGQEYGIRSSTVDIPLIASFFKAIEINEKRWLNDYKIVEELYKYAISKLNSLQYILINSFKENYSPYILNFSLLNGVKASVVLEGLSNKEIYVSSISACSSKGEEPSYVIYNLFDDKNRAANAIRISFSSSNTKEEIDTLIKELDDIVKKGLWETK